MVLSARVLVGVALLAFAGGRVELALAQGNGPPSDESMASSTPAASDAAADNPSANPSPSPNASPTALDNGSDDQARPGSSETSERSERAQGGQGTGGPLEAPSADAAPPQVEPPAGGEAPAQTDEDQALDAVQSGRAMPLDQIVGLVRETTPGEIIDATLVTRNGKLFYEIKVLEESGQVTILSYDALSGAPAN